MFCLGIKEVGDVVEDQSQRILEYVAQQLLRISPNYGFILMQGPLPLQIER